MKIKIKTFELLVLNIILKKERMIFNEVFVFYDLSARIIQFRLINYLKCSDIINDPDGLVKYFIADKINNILETGGSGIRIKDQHGQHKIKKSAQKPAFSWIIIEQDQALFFSCQS